MAERVYLQIKEKILEEIQDKPVNTPIRSERELSALYQASRMTVRCAINELVDEGVLYRDKNKGTFVADRKLLKKISSAEKFQKAEDPDYRVIYFTVKDAEPDIASHLGITTDDSIIRIVRINKKDGKAQSAEEIYYTRSKVPVEDTRDIKRLLDLSRYAAQGSLIQKLIPMTIPVKYANLLNMKIDTPIIAVESLITSKGGEPFVYIREYLNPQEKSIEITL